MAIINFNGNWNIWYTYLTQADNCFSFEYEYRYTPKRQKKK